MCPVILSRDIENTILHHHWFYMGTARKAKCSSVFEDYLTLRKVTKKVEVTLLYGNLKDWSH